MFSNLNELAYVYWLYDDRCICLWRHGYIGFTKHLLVRIAAHRRGPGSKGARSLPPDFKVQILFTGTIEDAYEIERQLRPHPGIGWNRAAGGQKSCLGYKHTKEFRQLKAADAARRFKGIPKSVEHRAKQRAAALARYAKPGEKERTQEAVKKAFKTIDRTGTNNGMFGKHMNEAAKQKVRDKIEERGGVSGENNPNYRHGLYSED